jgi:sugar phosphate isomerase/epimerase
MDFSFQLYSAQAFRPWDQVLSQLARIGYRKVEGFGALFAGADYLRAAMDREGIVMPSAHFPVALLEEDFDTAMVVAQTFGVNTVICPFLPADQRPADRAGWQAFADRLTRIGERVSATGRRFGWHNHDFEFKPLADGTLPMQLLLERAATVEWEADIAWVVRGGADPMTWIENYGERITLVHLKDIAPAGKCLDEDGWADVGHGTLDWAALLPALQRTGKVRHFVMEHDKPSDYRRFAERSLAAVQAY